MKKTHFLSKFSAKLAPNYEASFEIIEFKSPLVYILDQGEGKRRRIVRAHVSELKRYIAPRNSNKNLVSPDYTKSKCGERG